MQQNLLKLILDQRLRLKLDLNLTKESEQGKLISRLVNVFLIDQILV